MILFVILGYIIAEVYVLIWFAKTFGMIHLLFAFLFSLFLGAGLIRTRMASIKNLMQNPNMAGASSERLRQVLETMAIVLGGLLLVLPGLVSDFFGLLLVLPGLRGYWVNRAEAKIRTEVARARANPGGGFQAGRWQVFSRTMSVNWPPPGSSAQAGSDPTEKNLSNESRDVSPKVIDITPLVRKTQRRSDEGHDTN